MSSNTKVSVIVINWNGKHWLKPCLDSLREQSFKEFEIILTDNGSTDGSIEFVKENYQEVKIIENKENLGFTGANNVAAKEANGEFILFLNNDTTVDKDCIKSLWAAVVDDQKVGVCSCKMFSYDGKDFLANGLGMDIFGYQVLSKKIFYAEGAALFIRKKVFDILEGFDQALVAFAEDIDLCWRVQLIGYRIEPVEEAIVYHECGGTITGSKKKDKVHTTSVWRRFLTERNILRNQIKNYQFITLIFILPLTLSLFLCEMLFFLVVGKANISKDVYIKAIVENVKLFSDTLKQRKKIFSLRVVNDLQILKQISFKISKVDVLKHIGVPKFEQ